MRRRTLCGLALFASALLGWCFVRQPNGEAAQSPPKAGASGDAAFDKVVLPFVAKHCIACHGPQKKKANLTLHTYKDAKALLKDRKVWTQVLQMIAAGEMPPVDRPQPAMDENEAFQNAVLGIFAAADKGKRDPGKVTMRRLNRTEYRNTIRDLVGVDFDPTEDFPADDVGYGFDNIGDVLTVSPVLMERYLAAADAITRRAIVVGDPPKAPNRPRVAIFLEPPLVPFKENTPYRPLFNNKDHLAASHKLTRSGDYLAKVKVYGEQVGAEPVKFAILVNNKPVQEFAVKEDKAGAAKFYQVKVTLKKGPAKISVQLVNELADGDKKRGLFVNQIQLEGPLDNRPPSHRKIMAHKDGASKDDAAREILDRFVTNAYRRPATTAEVDRLVKLAQKTEKNGDRWEQGIQLALQAVLCSPKFLFRVEMDDRPDSAAAHPITDYQLAARLSYFLWSSMPDKELFDLAGRNELHANLEPQVRRMLKDPRASALTENFLTQWLQVRLLKNVTPDKKLFPEFDEPLRAAMLKETEMCFDAIVGEDRSILELIDSNYTFLNERLGKHYGIVDTVGNHWPKKVKGGAFIPRDRFVKVSLQDGERGGVLTQASVLTVTSNPTRTSPVKRGRWVLEQILGTPPPPPPPNVPELEEGSKAQLTGSLRQRMEQHRKVPSCANCHARMDPIGFAFENFDAVGKLRTKDGTFPIDTSGTLPGGRTFQGAGELKKILLGKKDLFARALSEKLLTYGLGRGVEYYDKPAIDRIVAAVSRNEYRFSALVVEITKSDPFRMRRGKDASK